jgi:hypothetical protein
LAILGLRMVFCKVSLWYNVYWSCTFQTMGADLEKPGPRANVSFSCG